MTEVRAIVGSYVGTC